MGWGVRCGASESRAGGRASGRASLLRTAAHARARPRLGREERGEEGLRVGYAAPRRDSFIAPGPGPAPPSSPPPPPRPPPPPPTTTAPPFWTRCVSGVRARGLAGRLRVRSSAQRSATQLWRRSGIAPGAQARPPWKPRELARPLRRQRRAGEPRKPGEARRGGRVGHPPRPPRSRAAAAQGAEASPRSPGERPSRIQGRAAQDGEGCCPSAQTVGSGAGRGECLFFAVSG